MTSKLEETIYYSPLYIYLHRWISLDEIIRIRLAAQWANQTDAEFVEQAVRDCLEKVEAAMGEIE